MGTDRDDREGTPQPESTVDANAPTVPPGDDGYSTVSWDIMAWNIKDGPDNSTRLAPHAANGSGEAHFPGGDSRFGARYASVVFHAEGGIGRVWKARDGLLGRDVALKEIRPEFAGDPRVERRFREEARITAGLEHPNIITMHDLSDDPARPFYTMRFLDGHTIKKAVVDHYRRDGAATPPPLDLRGLLDAFLDVCHALAFAHAKGVIHRDLKGQNIMLGPFGEVAVLDWGLAREIGSADDPLSRPTILLGDLPAEMSRTMEGYPIGTVQYMPPEQAAGNRKSIDIRSDIFGLGAILYLILTGRPPYEGPSVTETLRKALNVEFPRPSAVRASIPPALEAICLKAMSAKPEDRYQTASDLAADVRRWLVDQPVSAYPDTGFRAAARWARKHQRIVAGTTALLATATIALAVSTMMIASERDKVVSAESKFRRSFGIVQNVIPDVLERMTDPKLAVVPEVLAFRRWMVDKATMLAPSLTQFDVDDPQLCRLEALILRRAATLERLDDKFVLASDHLERAAALQRKLVTSGGDPAGDTIWLAEALKEKGSLDAAQGRFTQAEEEYREALGLDPPPPGSRLSQDFIRVTSWNQVRLSFVLRETGRAPEALAAAGEALQATTSLGTPIPGSLRDLAAAHLAKGRAQCDLGLRDEARTSFDQGVTLAKARVADAKDDTDATFDLADALLERAAFLVSDPLPHDRAITEAREALRLTDKLRRQYPVATYYRREQALARVILGGLLLEVGQIDEAETLATDARDEMKFLADKSASVVADQQVYGKALGLYGRIDRRRGRIKESLACREAAIARHARVLKLNPKSPDDLADTVRAKAD